VTSSLDRQAPCPSCGAPITFKFAGAKAQVCQHCKFVVARTDRGLQATGRMADLLDIPTPLRAGVTGSWNGEPFIVEGRLQMDRAGAPGAPWQEVLISFPNSGAHTWVAYAQGRWYGTTEQPLPPGGVPPIDHLRPGAQVDLGASGLYVVAEVGQRRVVSGEGELNNVPAPGVITRYADISGPGGRFGTIDYGDGSAPPDLYLGQQFDPALMKLDSAEPLEPAAAKVSALECPNCGGNLPLLSQLSERIVCMYCGTASDITRGKLAALGPSPPPPIRPYIAIGAEGNLRGNRVVCCGFMIRSCMVEGENYPWREYLLFAGERIGYQWLLEENGAWQHVTPVEPGEVLDSGHSVGFRGGHYRLKQEVSARVDYVIGEFYWKIEVGERVQAATFTGPGGELSRERAPTEVSYSFCAPLPAAELSAAFGLAVPAAAASGGSGSDGGGCRKALSTIVTVIVVLIVVAIWLSDSCDGVGGVGIGGPSIGGPSYGGGK
jgi:hypothetical protein